MEWCTRDQASLLFTGTFLIIVRDFGMCATATKGSQHAEGPPWEADRTRDLLCFTHVQLVSESFWGIAVKIRHRRNFSCGGLVVALLATIATASPRLLAEPTYTIDFGSISSISGSASQNACFQLAGEIGRPAPGFSSSAPSTPTYSMYSGFWTVAPTVTPDEIYFTSFEAC